MLTTHMCKVVASVVLFLLTLVTGVVPIYVAEFIKNRIRAKRTLTPEQPSQSICSRIGRRFTYERVIQFFTQLGGGVLLYTALIHMLPEIRENYESYLNTTDSEDEVAFYSDSDDGGSDDEDFWHSMPVVDLCAMVGFFAMFFIEEVMHMLFSNHHHHHGHPGHSHGPALHGHHHHHHHQQHNLHLGDEESSKESSKLGRTLSFRNYVHSRNYASQINESDSNISDSGIRAQSSLSNETEPISSIQPIDYRTCTSHTRPRFGSTNSVRTIEVPVLPESTSFGKRLFDGFMIILAFSCHSLFDGISIGVQTTNNETWTLLFAILSHKLIIAFILSFQIYEKCSETVIDPASGELVKQPFSGAKWVLWLYSTLFAAMSPLGIFIVLWMDGSNTPSEQNIKIIILAAISAGTIIYIVFLEIIDKSTSRLHLSGIVQGVALLIGFLVMHLISQEFKE